MFVQQSEKSAFTEIEFASKCTEKLPPHIPSNSLVPILYDLSNADAKKTCQRFSGKRLYVGVEEIEEVDWSIDGHVAVKFSPPPMRLRRSGRYR